MVLQRITENSLKNSELTMKAQQRFRKNKHKLLITNIINALTEEVKMTELGANDDKIIH